MQLPLVQYYWYLSGLSHFQQPPNGGSLSAMSSVEDSTHAKAKAAIPLPTTADQVKVPVVRQAKSLPTTADQVKVDDVYFGEASACHLKCTDGQDSTQRENFREVQHHSRIGKCPGCGTDSNLNTDSHCTVTIASQKWDALVATCGSCNPRNSTDKTPSPTESCFDGKLLMYILRPADVNTASDTASDTASADTSPDVSTAMANLSINPPPPRDPRPPRDPPPAHQCQQCQISNCSPKRPNLFMQCGCVDRGIACSDGCWCKGNCDNPNNV